VRTIGPVTDASGSHPMIASLTAQPGTGLLYAVDFFAAGIWTIDPSTAFATRLPSPARGLGLAFGPDGALYTSDSGPTPFEGGPVDPGSEHRSADRLPTHRLPRPHRPGRAE
jgi:hypothetical protein